MWRELGEQAADQRLVVFAHHVIAVEQILGRVAEQVQHQAGNGVEGPAPLLKAERRLEHGTLLFVAPAFHPATLDEFQIAEQGGHYLVDVFKPERREAKAHPKILEVGTADAASGGELVDPAFCFQQGEQAAIPFIADEVAQKGEGFFVIKLIHIGQRKGQRQLAGLLDRIDADADAEVVDAIERNRQGRYSQIAIQNGSEKAIAPVNLGLDGFRRDHHQRHAIRAVVRFVEPDEIGAQIPAGQIRQGIQVADRELGERVGRVDRLFMYLVAAAHIVLQLEAVFGVDRVALFIHPFGSESGADEELGKTVETGLEEAGVYLEKEVGELGAGPGIVAAAMTAHKLLVLTRLGISAGTKEQHMLKEMSHPLPIGRIVEMAGVDGQRGGRLVGVGIADQQDPEPVCQLQIVVLPMVIRAGIWAHWRVTRVGFI